MAIIERCNCGKYIPSYLAGSRCQECGLWPLRDHEIWCGDVVLIVQSCDCEYANIGMFRGRQLAYYHVNLSSLKRQWKPGSFSPDNLPAGQFDAVLAEHRDDVLALIARLNGQNTVQPALPMEY